MSVAEFSSVARLPSIGGVPAGSYITIDDATEAQFETYIPGIQPRWLDQLGGSPPSGSILGPRPQPDVLPHLVVFLTDGDPTTTIRTDRVTPEEYTTKVPLTETGNNAEAYTNVDSSTAVTPAIPNANALKAEGSHILALGVGAALQNQTSVDRLIQVSGPERVHRDGRVRHLHHRRVPRGGFRGPSRKPLRNAAFELCAPSVSVRRVYDPTPDPDTLDDAVPGVGWTLTGTVTAPDPGTFDWVLPVGATGDHSPRRSPTPPGSPPSSGPPTNPDGDSTIVVSEDLAANPPDPPGGDFVEHPRGDGVHVPHPRHRRRPARHRGGRRRRLHAVVPPESIVTCQLVNIVEPAPSIDIEKFTNGADADDPTGPFIPLGDPDRVDVRE